MGGTVAVTLRKPDGIEYRMDRWTNSMPWGICNAKMLQSDEQHIADYLHQWIEMRDDYEANKDTGNFEHNMTDCYFPSDGLAPCGYGLVVVDHVNKVILDMQDYTTFDYIGAAGVGLEIPFDIKNGDKIELDPDGDAIRLKGFLDAGMVKGVSTRKSYDEKREYDDISGMSFSDILIKVSDSKSRDWFQFVLDLGDWSYERFDDCDPQSLRNYRDRLLELGFKISKEENKVWEDLIKEYEEEYGYDE